jgi:hypothetical protein
MGEAGCLGWSMAAEISLLMSSNSVAVVGLAVFRGLEDTRPVAQNRRPAKGNNRKNEFVVSLLKTN